MKLMDLFSGIGGFALGLQQAGFELEKHYFSEIDKHAIANYKYNFKNAEYIGSVTDVRGTRGQADIITFGSPCQDFSLVGKRKGMEGQRSSLILEAIRLISEIQPSVFIWENVKGTFSSNDGADFWAILSAFANIGGYRLEWQLLNTSWFLPQNRERIYLIGHLDGRSRPGIFPIGENVGILDRKNNSRERQSQAKDISTTLSSGNLRATDTFIQVNSPTSKGYETMTKEDSINLSYLNSKTRRGRVRIGVAQTLDTQCNQGVMIGAFRGRNPENPKSRESGLQTEQMLEINENGVSNTLTSVAKDNVVVTKNYIQWDKSGKGYNSQQDRAFYEDGNMGTIPSGRTENKVNVLLNDFQIRRLTEIECERLQGFPDDWTKFGNYDGEIKEISKTQRYKMCGNAVTVNVVQEIGNRLRNVL